MLLEDVDDLEVVLEDEDWEVALNVVLDVKLEGRLEVFIVELEL